MKKTVIAMALVTIGVAGCNGNKSAGVPTNTTVADITAPAPAPMSAYQPAPQPVAQPIYDSAPAAPMAGAGSGSYTVKRGDTLYGIARQRYGDGKQWNKIANANPGLRPETLKVGQTIVVP